MKQTWVNLADKPYGGARGVPDTELKSSLRLLTNLANIDNTLQIQKDYLTTFTNWINNTQTNSILIDNSWHAVYSAGTSETFDKFYMKFKERRFCVLPGEYFYHKIAFKNLNYSWHTITSAEELRPGDAFIISMPFSDTGNEHSEMINCLNQCANNDIPVLLDCCYFGSCSGLDFPTSHPAIHTMTFSLSKCFDMPSFRVGIRYTKEDDDDPLFVYHKNNYINHLSATIATGMLQKFSSDFIWNKYNTQQTKICNQLQLDPSNCVNFATSSNPQYEYLRRGNTWSRLNVSSDFQI